MAEPKTRSRAYPAIPLQEGVDLLRRHVDELGWDPRDRDTISQALGYASGRSGIAARKIAALAHFGVLDLRDGLYSPTPLARRLVQETDEVRLRAALREACLSPALFQEIIRRYEPVGRVPRSLAATLSMDHGIQEAVQSEVAQIFMASATYAGILDSDGRFRDEYFEEAGRPRPQSRFAVDPSVEVRTEAAFGGEEASEEGLQVLKFFLTDQKRAELRLPARLNEQDIELLRAQLNFLELQVRLNRPDQPVRLDVVRGNRKR